MNCEGYRGKLVDALASGEGLLTGDVAAHLRACAECKRFYEAQVHLFGAIDSGVRVMVNVAVPASLLPRVRARMEEGQTARLWFPWLVPATGILVIVVLIVIPLFRYRLHKDEPRAGTVAERKEIVAEVRPVVADAPQKVDVLPMKKQVVSQFPMRPSAGQPVAQTPEAEVLVDPEEARGLVRLTTVVRETPNRAMAMLRPTELPSSEVDTIQPVRVSDLELKPLAEEDR